MVLNRKKYLSSLSSLFFLFIFLNDHTIFSDFFDQTSTYFLLIATSLIILSLLISKKLHSNNIMWKFFICWLCTVILPCIVAGITNLFFVRICYWFATLIMLLILKYNSIDYMGVLFKTIKIFCVWTLICYIYTILDCNFLPISNVSNDLLYNWYNVELHGYVIYKNLVTFSLGNFSIIKLYSPLGEPGIACMYFNFAVLYLLFFNKNEKEKRWFLIISLAIVLSFSLIGIAIFCAILAYYALYRKKYKYLFLFSFLAIIPISILVIQKLTTLSFTNRTSDYVFMFNTIKDNFPFGIGLGNIDNLDKTLTIAYDTEAVGFYCGLLYPLAQYGIFGFFYYYVMHMTFSEYSKSKYIRIAFSIYFLLTLLTQPQADECFILIFLFSGVIEHFSRNST